MSPGVARPGVMPRVAGLRNGAESPAQCAAAYVVSAHVTGRGGQTLPDASADDHEIAPDDAGSGEPHRLRRRLAPQVLAQVDAARDTEVLDDLARGGIQRVDEIVDGGEHARLARLRPVHEPAIGTAACDPGIEAPQ